MLSTHRRKGSGANPKTANDAPIIATQFPGPQALQPSSQHIASNWIEPPDVCCITQHYADMKAAMVSSSTDARFPWRSGILLQTRGNAARMPYTTPPDGCQHAVLSHDRLQASRCLRSAHCGRLHKGHVDAAVQVGLASFTRT